MSNPNKMLIDATHPEETRVVVLRNGRVEEFDYESAARKLLRGNIYLAKVTRVEPSLQAAFVDYGGNRHGFLAFNEIHPDYYQIPVADRQALLDEEAEQEAREEAEADARAERLERRQRQPQSSSRRRPDGEGLRATVSDDTMDGDGTDGEAYGTDAEGMDGEAGGAPAFDGDSHTEAGDETGDRDAMPLSAYRSGDSLSEDAADDSDELEVVGGFEGDPDTADHGASDAADGDELDEGDDRPSGSDDQGTVAMDRDLPSDDHIEVAPAPAAEAPPLEQTGSEDALEELPARQRRRPRSYKIQEVIKRRQIILIQVVKEERGNKGAALTTYLSLAGRYTVLMPNTARGGGISRKITQPQDRKRLKAIANELEVPEGMGLIIRTAGAARTKQEIKRDFEYLLRLWESVRDLTLESTAPSLVYEEGNLIKRSIRDLYNKDVEEIIVAGDHAHKDAQDFMRMLMPSHIKNVLAHEDPEPLFTKYGIERQLNAMFSPYVTLRSGGYLVINQTEALVAVDVNSGKSTREFSIEETAINTNLEAADEIARQVKLRDLAGLIVIDFIDMEEKRNNRSVERRLKDALRFDRARIQLGHISHFGLMEMSRQRMRTGVLEGSTTQCPHCQGTGIIRSTESVALAVLRGLEDTLMAGARTSLVATTTAQVALYILNSKRPFIIDMETRNGVSITVQASDKLQGANFTIERGQASALPLRRPERAAVNMDWGFEGDDGGANAAGDELFVSDEAPFETRDSGPKMVPRTNDDTDGDGDQGGGRSGSADGRKRRRRGGRRGGSDRERGAEGSRDGFRDGGREAQGGGREGGRDANGDREAQGGRQPRSERSSGRNNNGAPRPSYGDAPRPGYDDDGQRAEAGSAGLVADRFDGDADSAGDNQSAAPATKRNEDARGPRNEDGREPRGEDGRDDRGGKRRRRGRRGGRRGRGERGERTGPDGALIASDGNDGNVYAEGDETETSQPEASRPFKIHIGEEKFEDFGTAVMEDGTAVMEDRTAVMEDERAPAAPERSRGRQPQERRPQKSRPASERSAETPRRATEPAPRAPAAVTETMVAPAHVPVAAPKIRDRSITAASEPVLESVVVRPDGAQNGSADGATASPKRGWWQRTLGG